MQFELNLKCGGKVTRVEVLKNDKIIRTVNMNCHNHIVTGGRDYICTWRGDNQMPSIGLWSTDNNKNQTYEVAAALNMLYGFPTVNNYWYYYEYYNGDTAYASDSRFPMNNRHGQIGPLTFGKIGSSAKITEDTDTDLDSPLTDSVIDNYRNGHAGWHASCLRKDNSFTIKTAYCFSIQSDCTIREFGTFGKYAPTSVDITTSNYNQASIYSRERMFSRTVLNQPIEAVEGEQVVIIYEFTVKFPSKEEVVTTLSGHNCVRSFHLPPKDSASVLGRWYALNANCNNMPIGFVTTRNHSISSDIYSKDVNNTISSTIANSSCFPLCALRFCNKTTPASNYNTNYERGINAASALGMAPIAYIDDCLGDYSFWYRQNLLYSNEQGKLRNMLADCTTYEHTLEDYVPGTGYRIHNIALVGLKTNRPTIYGIGLMGYIYRFGHYEGEQFIAEPISIQAGSSISYKVKLQISNIENEEDSESEESSES